LSFSSLIEALFSATYFCDSTPTKRVFSFSIFWRNLAMSLALVRAVSLALVSSLTAVTVDAGPDHRGHDGGNKHFRGGDRGKHSFDNRHNGHRVDKHRDHHNHWKQGYWHHGHHNGRYGWWWITAGIWNFYSKPVYPYPSYETRVVVVEEPRSAPAVVQSSAQYWYYCDSSRNYYPYVSYCPEGWRPVPAAPQN
jgi:hypothetical protein